MKHSPTPEALELAKLRLLMNQAMIDAMSAHEAHRSEVTKWTVYRISEVIVRTDQAIERARVAAEARADLMEVA